MGAHFDYAGYQERLTGIVREVDLGIQRTELYPSLMSANIIPPLLEAMQQTLAPLRRKRQPFSSTFEENTVTFSADDIERAYELTGATILQLEDRLRTLTMMHDQIEQAITLEHVGQETPFLPNGLIYLRIRGKNKVCTIGARLTAAGDHDHPVLKHLACAASYEEAIANSRGEIATRLIAHNTERYPFAPTVLPILMDKYERCSSLSRENARLQ